MDMSFQLFSARNYPLNEVLKTVAGLGYKYVEGYGGLDASTASGYGGVYADPDALKAELDKNGLAMPTAHMGLDLVSNAEKCIALTGKLGIKVVICPWLAPDQRPTDAAGWKAFGEKLEAIAKPLNAAGLTFGYHNHDFEFVKLADGSFPMDVLLAAAPSIKAEVDVAWIYRGNADPFPWLEKTGNKIIAIHVKDLAPEGEAADEGGWADVGHGRLPWADLIKHAKAKTGAQYFVAEHDNPNDINRFASRSIATVNSFGV